MINSPVVLPQGSTATGAHFLKLWDLCQRKWFFTHLAPHPSGGLGLATRGKAAALVKGIAIHEGLANYLITQATTGTPNIEQAVNAAEAAIGRDLPATDNTELLAETRKLLWDYDSYWRANPIGKIEVVVDEEGPVVERAIEVHVREDLPAFTCRIDGLVKWNGWVYVIEHKTVSASYVANMQTELRLSLQGTGECFAALNRWPHLQPQGVLLNALVKNRSAKSKLPAFLRDPIARTRAQIRKFMADFANRLDAIETLKDQYLDKVEKGGDPWLVAEQLFLAQGPSTGGCHAYGRACEFLDLCVGIGNEALFVHGYDAKAAAPAEPADGEDF